MKTKYILYRLQRYYLIFRVNKLGDLTERTHALRWTITEQFLPASVFRLLSLKDACSGRHSIFVSVQICRSFFNFVILVVALISLLALRSKAVVLICAAAQFESLDCC